MISTVKTPDRISSHRPDVRIPLWCTIASLLLIGLSFDFHQPRWVDLAWTGFEAFSYLLIVMFLAVDQAYLGLVLAVQVSAMAFFFLAWSLAVGIGQAQGIMTGKWLRLLLPVTFLSVQGVLFLTASLRLSKIPEVARRPPAWAIVAVTLLGLYGLSSLVGWFIGWASGE